MTVEELLSRISSVELTEWAAYEELNGPLDLGHRADIHTGIIAATIGNSTRGKKGRRYKPVDFVPNWAPKRREPQTWQEQLGAVERINKALGGKDLRPE